MSQTAGKATLPVGLLARSLSSAGQRHAVPRCVWPALSLSGTAVHSLSAHSAQPQPSRLARSLPCSLHTSNTDFAAQTEERSSFCELLGAPQRRWLERVLASSRAPVKLIASGSVLFGSSGLGSNNADNDWRGWCSGGRCGGQRPSSSVAQRARRLVPAAWEGSSMWRGGEQGLPDSLHSCPAATALPPGLLSTCVCPPLQGTTGTATALRSSTCCTRCSGTRLPPGAATLS